MKKGSIPAQEPRAGALFQIRVSPEANDRMYDHFFFLAQVNEGAAHRLLEQLVKDIKSFEFMPQGNPYFDRPYLAERKYRYKLSSRRYRIVYQIAGECVFVEDIQDCRQSEEKNLV